MKRITFVHSSASILRTIAISALTAIFSIVFFPANAQPTAGEAPTSVSNVQGPIEIKGYTKELMKDLKGVIVTIYEDADGSRKNLKEIQKLVSPGNGQFTFKLNTNRLYMIDFSKAGYTSKRVDFDTDVRLARPEHTKVPTFEFEVDMVKDLDGLAFKSSVAKVFYHIKRNELDYELDYTKEEMEEEERKQKEMEEKMRLMELNATMKMALENQALSAREKEKMAAEGKIKAAALMGSDERKVKDQLVKVFGDADSLRFKKADVMYLELQMERQRTGGDNTKLNFAGIFNAASAWEQKALAEKAAADKQKQEEIKKVKNDALLKQSDAQRKEQEAQKLIMQEKLAKATEAEDAKRAVEEKAKRESVYNALLNSSNSKEKAIANLMTVFAKGDEYKEEKAEAMYLAYEKARKAGKTLANLNYSDLFAAARAAEDAAVEKKLEEERLKGNEKTNEIIRSIDEKKLKEEQAQKTKIEAALEVAKNETERKQAFIESIPKNDPYRVEKGNAMYAEFIVQQQQLNKSGSTKTGIDFGAIFGAAQTTEITLKTKEKEELAESKRMQQESIESKREAIRQEKSTMAQQAATVAQDVQKQKLGEAATQKEKKLADAISKANGDRSKAIEAIMTTFEKGTDFRPEKAEAIYDAYLSEVVRIKNTGSANTKIDFGKLFSAADKAELEAITKQYEAKKAETDQQLATYTQQRNEKAMDIAQAKAKEAVEKSTIATANLEKTKQELEAERIQRDKTIAEQREKQANQLAMEEARRAAELRELEMASMSATDKEKAQAIEKIRRENELAATKAETEQRKKADLAKAEEEKKKQAELTLLSKAEREKELALESQRKEEDRIKKEQELAAAKAQAEEKKKQDAAKAEQERLQAAQLAASSKAEKERIAKEAADKAEAERVRKEQEVAAAKAQAEEKRKQDAAKAEQERLQAAELAAASKAEKQRIAQEAADKAEAERVRKEQALAAEKAEKERLAMEAAKLAEAQRVERNRIAATEKAEKDRLAKIESDRVLAEKVARDKQLAAEQEARDRQAKELAEQKERDRIALENKKREEAEIAAKAAEEKRKVEEQFKGFVQAGDLAFGTKNYTKAKAEYDKAATIKADDRELKGKMSAIDAELGKLAAADAQAKEKEKKFNDLIKLGDEQMADGEFPFARNTYYKAIEMFPNSADAKGKIKKADDSLALALKQKNEEQAKERQYILLMQDARKAFEVKDFATAKKKYNDAIALKPDAEDPKKKLNDIHVLQTQLAAVDTERKDKERAARELAAAKAKEDEKRKADELAAKAAALDDLNKPAVSTETPGSAAAEEERKRKFEALKLAVEDMTNNAEERRRMFLTELSKLYPEGVTYELVTGTNYKLDRYVINNKGTVNVYEKRTWDWGGVFWFKDGSITITESLYNLELNRYKK